MTTTTEWQPDICIYHHPCNDGFAAAWTVWKKWGDDVKFYGVNYGEKLPEVNNKNVLFVDFSVKHEVMDELAQTASSIVVLDHHVTAEADLIPFKTDKTLSFDTVRDIASEARSCNSPDWFVIAQFDMEKSGARLAWEFCFPDTEVPEFIRHIEDRDLWRYALPGTRRFTFALGSYDYDFELWDTLDPKDLIQQGEHIERFYDKKVQELCETSTTMKFLGGHIVPVVNCPKFMASDVCHALLKQYPQAQFAASYHESEGVRGYSLRSENNRKDVSKIAENYGGGGHRNAAGFTVPL